MAAAGYDRSFELLGSAVVRTSTGVTAQVTWRDVELDAGRRVVRLPAGAGLDFGGIGKGWAVDRLARMLGRPSLVNGGGDVFASGSPPDGPAWLVGVEDPFRPDEDLLMLRAVDRGVATSSSLRRRWRSGDTVLHHLIDPHTGRPSESDAVQVTVIASSTLMAEYHAKVALLLGAGAGLDYLDHEPDIDGAVVKADGALLTSRYLTKYV
jgi:thiamine biosynthesis lipoprotein